MTDEFETDFDETDPVLEDEDENENDEESEAEADGESGDKTDKRLRDLQSKADKATAEANKLRKELEKLQTKGKDEGKEAGDVPPELRQWLTAAQDRVRDQLYGQDPRFKEYGIDPSLITGSTPAEMRTSAAQLKKFVDRVETKVRNRALREHGFDPEPQTSIPAGKRKSYATMTAEEFEAEVQRALSL